MEGQIKKIYPILLFIGLLIPTSSFAQTFNQDLYFGISNDPDVSNLQEFLTSEKVYSGPITGNFFSLTLEGVKKFQNREGITPVAGYFGPKTRAKVNEIISSQIQASNKQALEETGQTPSSSSMSQPSNAVPSLQNQILILQQQIALLLEQLKSQLTASVSAPIVTPTPTSTSESTPLPTPTVSIEIMSVNIVPGIDSAKLEWQTNLPTNSKIFLSGGGLSSKIFNSDSGLSTRHLVNISSLVGDTNYSYEIEAIADNGFDKRYGSFQTQTPPAPTFSVEEVLLPNWPNNIYLRINSANGTFIFQALTLEIDNPNKVVPANNNQSNMDFIQRQTLARGGWNYRTCDAINNAFQAYSNKNYPYSCPQSDNPGYLTMSNPDWMGRSVSLTIDPNLPFPQGTRIYYYKVKEQNTGKIFEYRK